MIWNEISESAMRNACFDGYNGDFQTMNKLINIYLIDNNIYIYKI